MTTQARNQFMREHKMLFDLEKSIQIVKQRTAADTDLLITESIATLPNFGIDTITGTSIDT